MLYKLRSEISLKMHHEFDGVIQSGIFKGCKIPAYSEWGGSADLSPKLLGIYESEVLEELPKLSKDYRTLIDIGAADGYYAIGCLKSGLVESAYCFDIDTNSHSILKNNAKNNNIFDNIYVYEEASKTSIEEILEKVPNKKALFIIDIEGAEFSLITKDLLDNTVGSTYIIELHEWVEDSTKLEEILQNSEKNFYHKFLSASTRSIPDIDYINRMPDNERWLICSEGRPERMRWLVLEPK